MIDMHLYNINNNNIIIHLFILNYDIMYLSTGSLIIILSNIPKYFLIAAAVF